MGWFIHPGVVCGLCTHPEGVHGLVYSSRSGLWVGLFIPEGLMGWFIHPGVVKGVRVVYGLVYLSRRGLWVGLFIPEWFMGW